MFLSQARSLGKARILGCPRTFFRALCQPHVKNGCSRVYRLRRTRVLFLTPLGDRRFSNPNPSGNGSPPSLNPLRIIWTGGGEGARSERSGTTGGNILASPQGKRGDAHQEQQQLACQFQRLRKGSWAGSRREAPSAHRPDKGTPLR